MVSVQGVAILLHHAPEGALTGVVLLTSVFREEGERWVGKCIELGTSAYGDSLREARGQLFEAIELQLNEVERLGFIDEYLQEHDVYLQPIPQKTDRDRWVTVTNGALGKS